MVRKPKTAEADAALAVDAAAPEPLATSPAPDTVPARTGKAGAVGVGAVAALVAAGLGYGAAVMFPLFPNLAAPAFDASPPVARLDALEAAQAKPAAPDAQLEQRLAALESTPAIDLAPIEARLAGLESRLQDASTPAELRAEIAAIRAELAKSDPAPAIKAAIAAEMKAVQKTAKAMQSALDAAAAGSAQQSALMLVQAAMDTGAPYVSAVQTLDLPPALADHAATGIPSLTELKGSFPAAARAGLDAALGTDLGATWGERVTNFLRKQTGARALSPIEGAGPDAVLSRVAGGLERADMTAVMAEIAALPPAAQSAMSEWIAAAQTRADALAALSQLEQRG